jgi:hypothetical protein
MVMATRPLACKSRRLPRSRAANFEFQRASPFNTLEAVAKVRRYLYRALNQAEIDAGNVLIPKATNKYKAGLILPFDLPEILDETPQKGRRRHQ